jgi:hypothetical protein
MVYFVLALWLFRGRNSGYGQVMAKLAHGLYHQRRGADLLAGRLDPGGWVDAGGGQRWKQPNISSLSRGRVKLGPDPVRMLFEQVTGPAAPDGAEGVFCCGLRIVSMDGSVTDVPDSKENDAFFGRPSNQSRDGAFPQVRWVAAAESGTGSLLGAAMGPYRTAEQPLALDLLHCFGPGMVVLADRKFLSWSLARAFLATGAHLLWRASASFTLKPVAVQPLLRGHVESLTDGNLALNPSWLLIPGESSNLRRVNCFLPSRLAGGITASSVVTQDSWGFGLRCGRGLVHGARCHGQHSLDRRRAAPEGRPGAVRPGWAAVGAAARIDRANGFANNDPGPSWKRADSNEGTSR